MTICDKNTRLDGKTAIVTGGSSGIGYETAKNLALRGAKVIIASRNETKLTRARDRLQKITNNKLVSHKLIDLASLKSIRSFAAYTINTQDRLDILINNAGAIGLPDRLTEDGLNLTMQVNYFGAFLLTYLLLPLLKNSAPSRIINSSASSMYVGHIDFDHWNDVGRYNSVELLANSKLAVALFTAELDNRFRDSGVTANSFDPFLVRDTDLLNNLPDLVKNISRLFVDVVGQPKQGVGKQVAALASNPELEMESGQHYKFCRKWINHWLVSDQELTSTLWDISKGIVKITPEEDWEANSV
ncbi:retinol dehydrogenase 13-like [Maniola hyperantus]|uniref:retinol dehydrogenase 13-like n=1 Tax=Aphantopus hyperantus TaxID=2795564 RepID=UPI00156A1EB3|nr:retinol dehydrogenase 13-like [Maniola hyperantus]